MPDYSDALKPFSEQDPNEAAALRVRGAVKPPGGRQEGAATKALAGYIPHAIGNMASLPQRAVDSARRFSETGEYDPAPIVETALSLYGANAPFAQAGAAGIFGGKLAKTADHAKLARAQEMDAAGASPNHIWHNTGWFKAKDGMWRFEIPDADATLAFGDKRVAGTLGNFLDHRALYEAYPQARYMRVAFDDLTPGNLGLTAQGPSTNPFGGKITVDPKQIATSPEYAIGNDTAGGGLRRVMLHEIQHPVQRAEGHTSGGSPSGIIKMLQAKVDEVLGRYRAGEKVTPEETSMVNTLSNILHDPKKNAGILHKTYERLLGEVEARNVEARANFNEHARQFNPPWSTWDIPTDRQIVPGGK